MPARQSSACDEALRLYHSGLKPTVAARQAGVARSTLYRALARQSVDPTPWCNVCKARTADACKCVPLDPMD